MNLKKQLIFLKKLESLYKGGRPLVEIFDSLANSEKSFSVRSVYKDIAEDIKAGSSFAGALSRHDDFIDEAYKRLIHIGETSGRLDEVLRHLISLITSLINIRRKVIAAMLYPCALFGVYFLVFFLIFFVLIPIMVGFIAKSGLSIPWFMHIIVWFKNLLFSPCGCCGIPLTLIILVLLVYAYLNFGFLDYFRSRVLLFVPGFGRLDKLKNLYAYVFTLKICYDSGISNIEATELAVLNLSNVYMYEKLSVVSDLVKSGRSMYDSLTVSDQFDYELSDFVKVGEDSGKLNDSYDEMIRIINDRINMTIAIMVGMVKPLGIIFGVLMLAGIFLSIGIILYGILSSVKSVLPH